MQHTTARHARAGRSAPALTALLAVGLGVALFLGGAVGLVRSGSDRVASPSAGFSRAPVSGQALDARITSLQDRLRTVPSDYASWASLGLAYVEQARITADPSYYPKAQGALDKSLRLETRDNFAAAAGQAALASARHDFAAARDWAQRGLQINPASAILYGALGDAETQLGDYPASFAAIQRMVDLAPDTASLARASYAWELRGNLAEATANMRRALDDAATPADRAFARYYLGELAFNQGDAAGALVHYRAGLGADPSYPRLLQGKAKAEAALGQIDAAVADYATVVERLPEPAYVIEFGELLDSVGRTAEAAQQFELFDALTDLFEANGVKLDVDATLFYADHGDPARALRYAEEGIRTRSFVEMQDAYAWALHVNGRDAEALTWSQRALSLGTQNALFYFHSGTIKQALGDVDGGRADLDRARAINPHFSFRWAS